MSAYRLIGGLLDLTDRRRMDFSAKLMYALAIGKMDWECKKPSDT